MAEKRCGAKTRIPGRRCINHPTPGRRRCRLHGGKTPVGPASPHWKHGDYSRYMPTNILPRFDAAMADLNYGSLKKQIALAEARILELLEHLSKGTAKRWPTLQLAFARVAEAAEANDASKLAKSMSTLGAIIDAGCAAERTWGEIYDVMDLRRRLTDVEGKNLERLRLTMTFEQGLALIQTVVRILTTHVHDPEVLSQIGQGLRDVLGTTALQGAAA